jgi:hypothetical protein
MNAIPASSSFVSPAFRIEGLRLRIRHATNVVRLLPVLGCLLGAASAEQFGDFTYIVNDPGGVETVTITDYPSTATGAVEVPATIEEIPVTSIGSEAFSDCGGISAVTLPSTITSIGDRAFINCGGLTSAPIPSAVTSLGTQAFAYCSALTTMTVPSGVTAIPDSLFEGCFGLTHIVLPEGVLSIGSNAFNTCVGLTSVTIPSTVTSIGASAFIYCSGLTGVVIPTGVTVISSNTFLKCTSLTSVSLPNGLLTISGSAFAECTSLPSIAIPTTVTSIGTFAFTKCTALTAIAIPSGVPIIGTSMFDGCSSLASVTIPGTVTSIGSSAFRSCASLSSIHIPASVTSFGSTDVFSSCSALTSITVAAGNPNFSSLDGVLFNKLQTSILTYPRGLDGPYTVPDTVTTLGASSFRFAVGVTSLSIPASVTTIGSEFIYGCTALTSISVNTGNPNYADAGGVLFNKGQTTLIAYPSGLSGAYTVPAGVNTISASAFRYNAGLTAVTLPDSVTAINSNAFASCSLLVSATFEGNAPTMGSNVFQSAAAGFKVYYYEGKTGFTPNLSGYTTIELGALTTWLASYGLAADSDLGLDANGDGVSLLMAYALDLNPNQNLSGSMPQPVIAASQMSLSYKAGAVGVTYAVEASTDLTSWSTEGVVVSGPDTLRTATVDLSGPSRFMRLVVSH